MFNYWNKVNWINININAYIQTCGVKKLLRKSKNNLSTLSDLLKNKIIYVEIEALLLVEICLCLQDNKKYMIIVL